MDVLVTLFISHTTGLEGLPQKLKFTAKMKANSEQL